MNENLHMKLHTWPTSNIWQWIGGYPKPELILLYLRQIRIIQKVPFRKPNLIQSVEVNIMLVSESNELARPRLFYEDRVEFRDHLDVDWRVGPTQGLALVWGTLLETAGPGWFQIIERTLNIFKRVVPKCSPI